jgi:PPP family 3-phenylpropionic acid transporter
MVKDPRAALATYYAAYFACMGIVLPFLPAWIKERNFSPAIIGLLLALQPLGKITAPWTWGRLADRSGRRKMFLIVATAGAAAALALLGGQTGFLPIFLLAAFYSFSTAPCIPYTEATALEQSERLGFTYGPIRMWGSIAFMAVSVGFGAMVDFTGTASGLLIGSGFLCVAVAAAVRMPGPVEAGEGGTNAGTGTGGGTGRSGVIRLFTACALMQASHGAYYAFFTISLQQQGYGGTAIGLLWAFAVLCEVLLLTRIDGIIERLGTKRVQQVCIAAAAARWIIIAVTGAVLPLVFAQGLHALTYAAFHVATLRDVHARFDPGSRATGQTLYSGLTYGLGIFVGTLTAGSLVETIGFHGLFFTSAAVAMLSLAVMWTVPEVRRNGTDRKVRTGD